LFIIGFYKLFRTAILETDDIPRNKMWSLPHKYFKYLSWSLTKNIRRKKYPKSCTMATFLKQMRGVLLTFTSCDDVSCSCSAHARSCGRSKVGCAVKGLPVLRRTQQLENGADRQNTWR